MGPVIVQMYEREAVVAAVRRLLDAASAGRGGTVFVVAPAGLGKTSVLHAAVAEAQGRFDVRMGGGDAVETALPYGLIGQVLTARANWPPPMWQGTCRRRTGSMSYCGGSAVRPSAGRCC